MLTDVSSDASTAILSRIMLMADIEFKAKWGRWIFSLFKKSIINYIRFLTTLYVIHIIFCTHRAVILKHSHNILTFTRLKEQQALYFRQYKDTSVDIRNEFSGNVRFMFVCISHSFLELEDS